MTNLNPIFRFVSLILSTSAILYLVLTSIHPQYQSRASFGQYSRKRGMDIDWPQQSPACGWFVMGPSIFSRFSASYHKRQNNKDVRRISGMIEPLGSVRLFAVARNFKVTQAPALSRSCSLFDF